MEEEALSWDEEILSTLPQPEVRQFLFLLALNGHLPALGVLLQLCGAPGKGGWGPGRSQSPCFPVPDLGGGSIIYPNPIPPRHDLLKLRWCFSTEPSASERGSSPARKEEKKVRESPGSGVRECLGRTLSG